MPRPAIPATNYTVSPESFRSGRGDPKLTQARTLENAFFRYKLIIGDGLRARSPGGRVTEAVIACNILNQMTEIGRPESYRVGRRGRWAPGRTGGQQAGDIRGGRDRIGPCRGPIRRPWEGCPGRLSRAPHPDHGNRLARRSPAYRCHLAPDVSRLLGAAPATVEIARHPQKKLWVAPERSRSAIISRTGWRWGQSRANPSRTSISEHKTNTRVPDQSQNTASESSIDSASSSRRLALKRISSINVLHHDSVGRSPYVVDPTRVGISLVPGYPGVQNCRSTAAAVAASVEGGQRQHQPRRHLRARRRHAG